MRLVAILFLLVVVVGYFCDLHYRRQQKKQAASLKQARYKELERRAKRGDIEAMQRLAELFYEETDSAYYPVIFKWVSILAPQINDPAVWLELGDLWAYGCGTEKDLKQATSCYEKALAADIAAGQNSNLPRQAHNYLETRLMQLRSSQPAAK